jgi:hypothetical protein
MLKGSFFKKAVLFGTAVAVVGSLIGTSLVASAQSNTSTQQSNNTVPGTPTVTHTPRPKPSNMHPRWWAHIFRQAARGDFDTFTGAELRYKDGANPLVIGGHPGTVTRIGENELMIKPNGGGDPVLYTFRPDTDAHLEEFRKHFRNIEIGDKVIIITVNGMAKWVIVVNDNDRNDDKREEKDRERIEKQAEKEQERAEKQRELEAKKAEQLKEREAKKAEQAKEREAKKAEIEAKAKELQEKARQRAEEARKKAEERRDNRGNATSTVNSART